MQAAWPGSVVSRCRSDAEGGEAAVEGGVVEGVAVGREREHGGVEVERDLASEGVGAGEAANPGQQPVGAGCEQVDGRRGPAGGAVAILRGGEHSGSVALGRER